MKYALSIVLGLVCIGLVVVLVSTKRSQAAQHEKDLDVITLYSNQLISAQSELDLRQGRILTLSNSLDEVQSNSLAVSNQLGGALSAMASANQQQSANLNRRMAEMESENQTLVRGMTDLTNQIVVLSQQISSNQVSMNTVSNDFLRNYSLLENRLRRDVGERVVTERQFNTPAELQAQLEKLKYNPPPLVTPQNIYRGLDVEVESNGTFHVLAPQ